MACSSCSGSDSCKCSINTIVLPSVKGDKGDKGNPGAAGATGPQGPQGVPGTGKSLICLPMFSVKDGVLYPFFLTDSFTPVTAVNFLWPGSVYFGTPASAKVVARGFTTTGIATTAVIELGFTVGLFQTFTAIASTTVQLNNFLSPVVLDLGALSNVPTSESLLILRCKVGSSAEPGNLTLHGLNITAV